MFRDDSDDLLDSIVSFHDRYRFEVKLDVNLQPERRSGRYAVEAYFFVPKSLGVSRTSYPKERFYQDIQNYIRFKTPHISLAKLMDPSNDASPLYRVLRGLAEILSGSPAEPMLPRIVNEAKLLGCMMRSTTRDHVRFFLDELLASSRSPEPRRARTLELLDSGLNLVRELRALVREIRSVKVQLQSPVVPARLRDAYDFLDEFVSLTAESYLTLFLQGAQSSAPAVRQELKTLEKALQETLKSEAAYRREAGYRSVITPGSENEEFAWRRSLLKKFMSSVLFLKMEVLEERTWQEFFFGMAAAVAMLFWVVLTLAVQRKHQADTLLVGGVAVVGYVFKDRIKAWLQTFFSRNMGRWLPDHRVRIVDPSGGRTIGVFQEAFAYVDSAGVPADVTLLRRRDGLSAADEEGRPERVLKYDKSVTLYPKRILEEHSRLHSINDITRFSVASFLGRADDPHIDHTFFSPETGELAHTRLARTYPIEVVFRYRLYDDKGKEEVRLERVRLIVSRKGIRRLEQLAPDKIPV